MKVFESKSYDRLFPENFTWGYLENITLSNISVSICNQIYHELRIQPPSHRLLIAGLREALNVIAENAKI